MNKKLKNYLKIAGFFVVSFASMILIIYIGAIARAMSISESVGVRYEIMDIGGRDILRADYKDSARRTYNDSIAIQNYKYNDDFALLFGWDSPQAIIQQEKDSIYRNYEQTLELFQKENKPFFMIIDKRNDSIHFPLTLTEYLILRRELGVPDDLELKLRL